MIIADFGSGNTCKNDFKIISQMIDKFAEALKETRDDVVIKWQLFQVAGGNVPLQYRMFDYAYGYAASYGYKTTASVFDPDSLKFLLRYDVPFVKIANNKELYYLQMSIPNNIPAIVSGVDLCCVSKYPATMDEYEKAFKPDALKKGISDHTIGWHLYKKYSPKMYEFHYCLDDSDGLDAGPWARRPKELKELL